MADDLKRLEAELQQLARQIDGISRTAVDPGGHEDMDRSERLELLERHQAAALQVDQLAGRLAEVEEQLIAAGYDTDRIKQLLREATGG